MEGWGWGVGMELVCNAVVNVYNTTRQVVPPTWKCGLETHRAMHLKRGSMIFWNWAGSMTSRISSTSPKNITSFWLQVLGHSFSKPFITWYIHNTHDVCIYIKMYNQHLVHWQHAWHVSVCTTSCWGTGMTGAYHSSLYALSLTLHTHTHTHTHTGEHRETCTLSLSLWCTHTRVSTEKHALSLSLSDAHTHTHTGEHRETCTLSLSHWCTYTHTHALSLSLSLSLTHTHGLS